MPRENNMPSIRFAGFSGTWERRKLNDITLYKTSSLSASDVNVYGDFDIYDACGVIGKTTTTPHTVPYITIIKDGSGVGKTRMLPANTCFIGTMGGLFPKKGNDIKFIFSLLGNFNFSSHVVGGAIPHIYYSDYGNEELEVPPEAEQLAIGDFFLNLDTLISLHRRKCEQLETLKKSMLEKLFPKEGKLVPDLRFAGFTGKWERTPLGEITHRFDNLRVPVSASARIPGCTPYYGANGIQDYVEGYTHDGEFILIAEDGANDDTNYPVNYVKGRIWVNNHAHVLQAQESVADNIFLSFAIGRANFRYLLVGGSRSKLNASTLTKIVISRPTKCEQKKMGTFFYSLDRLLTLHRRKLELLQNIKKACLEKMFV